MRPPALELREMAGIQQDFAGSLPATKGLTASPWALLASLCFQRFKQKRKSGSHWPIDRAGNRRKVVVGLKSGYGHERTADTRL
jgi:hypothetical protein